MVLPYLNDGSLPLMRVLVQVPEFDDAEGYEVKKLSGSPRYCRMCRGYKPPRAHHCKTCKKYVSAQSVPPLFEHFCLSQMRAPHG